MYRGYSSVAEDFCLTYTGLGSCPDTSGEGHWHPFVFSKWLLWRAFRGPRPSRGDFNWKSGAVRNQLRPKAHIFLLLHKRHDFCIWKKVFGLDVMYSRGLCPLHSSRAIFLGVWRFLAWEYLQRSSVTPRPLHLSISFWKRVYDCVSVTTELSYYY